MLPLLLVANSPYALYSLTTVCMLATAASYQPAGQPLGSTLNVSAACEVLPTPRIEPAARAIAWVLFFRDTFLISTVPFRKCTPLLLPVLQSFAEIARWKRCDEGLSVD